MSFYKRVEKNAEKQRTRITKFGETLGRNELMAVSEPDYLKWREIVKNANTRSEAGKFEIQKLAFIIVSKPKDMTVGGHRKLVAFITDEMNNLHPIQRIRQADKLEYGDWPYGCTIRKETFSVELSAVQKALVDCVTHNGLKKQLTDAFMNRKPLYPESMPSNREIEQAGRKMEGGEKKPVMGEVPIECGQGARDAIDEATESARQCVRELKGSAEKSEVARDVLKCLNFMVWVDWIADISGINIRCEGRGDKDAMFIDIPINLANRQETEEDVLRLFTSKFGSMDKGTIESYGLRNYLWSAGAVEFGYGGMEPQHYLLASVRMGASGYRDWVTFKVSGLTNMDIADLNEGIKEIKKVNK